jgi:hypothetical protein
MDQKIQLNIIPFSSPVEGTTISVSLECKPDMSSIFIDENIASKIKACSIAHLKGLFYILCGVPLKPFSLA